MNDDITEINSFLPPISDDKTKIYCNFEREEWMSLFLTLFMTLGVTACSLVILIFNYAQFDPINLSLIIILFFNCVMLFYYMINGILSEKEYDLYIGYIMTLLIITAMCTYEFIYHFNNHHSPIIKLVRLLICFASGPISFYVVLKIAEETSWTEFKIVGASDFFQDIYRQSGYFVSLLKVDCQLSICAMLLEFRMGPHLIESYSIILMAIGIPICLVVSKLGYRAMRTESVRLTFCFFFGQMFIPMVIVYQFYQIYIIFNTPILTDYLIVYASLLFGGSCFISKGVLLYEAKMIVNNFNQGLKERAFCFENDQEVQPLLFKVKRRKLKINNCCNC